MLRSTRLLPLTIALLGFLVNSGLAQADIAVALKDDRHFIDYRAQVTCEQGGLQKVAADSPAGCAVKRSRLQLGTLLVKVTEDDGRSYCTQTVRTLVEMRTLRSGDQEIDLPTVSHREQDVDCPAS